MMSNIFINNFCRQQRQSTKDLIQDLEKLSTLDDLEIFLYGIAAKFDTDKQGTTTWVNDKLIIRTGYFPHFTVPLSVTLKDNQYGSEKEQIQSWIRFRKVCEMIQSGEYRW
jgi:delta-aminolevulinic acid dehydratase/porphobilinogen synthase